MLIRDGERVVAEVEKDPDALRATVRACLRELDEERDLLRKTAERWKRDADSDDYWGHHNADLLLDLLPDG